MKMGIWKVLRFDRVNDWRSRRKNVRFHGDIGKWVGQISPVTQFSGRMEPSHLLIAF